MSPFDALVEQFGTAANLTKATAELQRKLTDRGIYFGDGLIPTYPFAYTMPRERNARWIAQAELLVRAGEEMARQLVEDRAFYDAVGLGADARALVEVDPGYRSSAVLFRPDGIPVGDDLKFVELNCDSPAMMMFLDIVGECLLELDAFAPFRGAGKLSHAADRLLDTLLACAREHGKATAPTIAITDWEGQKTRYEHARLAEHFERRGTPTVICDPRAFTRVGSELHAKGRKIDLVYRRALSSELVERSGEVEALLGAYRDGSICMVNPLRSYVGGVKSVLSEIARGDRLPAELRGAASLVPRTLTLDTAGARDEVRANPSQWALKKSESHGGLAVILPDVQGEAAWHEALASTTHEVWIAQEYLRIPQLPLPVVAGDAIVREPKYYNWNPFLFGGTFAGGLVRVSSTPLINITLGGGLMPTLVTG